MRIRIVSMLAAIMLLAGGAFAQAQQAEAKEPKLKLGDRAPALTGGEWVKGEPVSEFESGKVYVVEFWATWCGPCIAAMPHLSELQRKYEDKGLIVIAQSVAERDPAAVKPKVEEMGDKMAFRVVTDEPSGQQGSMLQNWMVAAGRNTIPTSFIVDQDGRIAFIGTPTQLDKPLEQIFAGKWDIEAAREQAEKAAADEAAAQEKAMAASTFMSKFRSLARAEKWEELYAETDKAIDNIENAQTLNEIAWVIVDPVDGFPEKDLDVALKAATKASDLTDNNNGAILDTLARVYWLKGDRKKALELQEKAVEVNDEPQFDEELKQRLEEYRKGQNAEQ